MKFKIKDNTGCVYNVEREQDVVAPAGVNDAEDLTADEKKLLKALLKRGEEILALLDGDEKKDDEGFTDEDLEVDEDLEANDACEEKDKVADTEAHEKVHDSKMAFGSIEARNTVEISAADQLQDEIAQAWAKHYGG